MFVRASLSRAHRDALTNKTRLTLAHAREMHTGVRIVLFVSTSLCVREKDAHTNKTGVEVHTNKTSLKMHTNSSHTRTRLF